MLIILFLLYLPCMRLVNEDNSINCFHFKCLDTNTIYTIVTTTNTHPNSEPHYFDKAHKAVEEVLRSDGVRRKFTRLQLKKRFINIEQLKLEL